MKRIPVGPLRAFDVAARNLNLSAAAEEMNVTHAAVSRQVKQLEERLGVKLFERLPRGLRLTAQGALLAEGTRAAFDRLASALEDVSTPTVRRKLTVSTFSSFNARWLMPRLRTFSMLFPDVDLQVITTAQLVDFAREDVDIGIRFGRGNYPGLHVVPLFRPREIVVCAPALLKGGPPLKNINDLRHFTLLHDDSYRSWTRWLEAVGAKNVNPRRGIICGDRNSLLQATLEGQGVGLASEVFAAGELAAGRLVKVFETEVKSEYSIYAVCLPRRLNDPMLAGVMEWLEKESKSSHDVYPPPSD
ncbi:transcriptional regulator GcvA [Steroidobacter sp. S1-65]|uniref:Transcriptional regulator GcvA n=1 Tax=Steroidobacter gossypii TaxID=2805490 RepID=A0ABS1WUA9_9GAMM|nr:transcriptional regulator GcvA [Steroidobacter gossypii]MBM0104560.1 transcriptional regulator GcvA [Steroidobacter gossypii]